MGITTQQAEKQFTRVHREDEIAFVLRARKEGIAVDDLVADAEKVRAFMESTPSEGRAEWSTVSTFVDLVDERDRARETAVRLEQELAEAERKLDAQNNDLVKGVLLEVRRQGEHTLTEAGRVAIARAVERSAHNFRVTL